ncbi:carbon-nitrogen hydrolase family protein [Pseudoruegeria sp. SK021]|uniref:carbon-nitrogen hydrolase family protein n=1 Tax=Pseudoruegeria sp. SK021 TaxID=1933035 RepID=UPI000A235CC7|nr:carbon-nitrogen hydrolase family protein [Pseudoruegeria sp. SK021]OSP54905.1 nitrilase [Pseudoruegeria sp. SK021]
MKLAVYQSPTSDGNVEDALSRLSRMLMAAAQAGAEMLVAPELYLPGYNRPDLHQKLAQDINGPWCQRLADMCRMAGCGVTLGWAERDGDAVYNSATCFGSDGQVLGHYRKLQLFGPMEAESFTAGNRSSEVFDLGGMKTGLLICYDVEFPQLVEGLHAKGADLILVPTANPVGYEHVQHVLIPARAYDAGAVIAYANYCGDEAGLAFSGLSLIAGPDAAPLASAGKSEALLIVDLPAVG